MEKPKKLTKDEEIHELAQKLDQQLEDFINSCEKTPYKDGWNEETWEKEMEEHPFFMTKLPEEGEPLPPLLEAFQQLKYDPEENTREDIALTYKADGNFNFKVKKYRFAIANYTEGLKQKCGQTEVDAALYLNRAAAHYHLENYRSSLNDCLCAAKLKPDYTKAIVRATQCCIKLKRYTEGLQWCDYGLRLKNSDPSFVTMRTELILGQKLHERNKRKELAQEKKEEIMANELLEAIHLRGIVTGAMGKTRKPAKSLNLSYLEPCHPAAVGKRVHVVDNCLIWPVLFLYPEYGETDLIQEFHEDTCFLDHLEVIFEQPPPWDKENKYKSNTLRIYYENTDTETLYKVDARSSLKSILSQKTYIVRAGTPGFICVVGDSKFEREFLTKYKAA